MKDKLNKSIKEWFIRGLVALLIFLSFAYSLAISWARYVEKFDVSCKVSFISSRGGRLGISKDQTIAFDCKGSDGFYDLFTMNLDGSHRTCLTSETESIPQKHNGNPSWHPNGKHIVFQSVDPNLEGLPPHYHEIEKVLTGPGAGVNNNLWITDINGKQFWQLTRVKDKNGVLHPHFSHDGKKLLWSEMIDHTELPSGKWVIRIGDITIEEEEVKIENIITLQPQNMKFYETHGFSPDDKKILFSGSPSGYYQNMDIYEYDLHFEKVLRLTGPDREWDEHAHYSPDGKKIIWMSSKGISQIIKQYQVKTDYWIMDRNGLNKKRVTYFNDPQSDHFISGGAASADCDWLSDTKIIGYLKLREKQLDCNVLLSLWD
jgi:Tol biopolymer transport system component